MSSLFKEAKRLGYCDANPAVDVLVDPRAAEAADTYAYDLPEIEKILAVLPEPAATIFAVACYAGLRRGEIEALRWENYRAGHLNVEQSVWCGKVGTTKSKSSRAAVPVIPELARYLEAHKLRCGEPKSGWIFSNLEKNPLSLHNVVCRVIVPTLEAERVENETVPRWHGFHAGRRGLGSNLYRLGVTEKTIQAILRHSDVATTVKYYVKANEEDLVAGIAKLQAELERRKASQANRTGTQLRRSRQLAMFTGDDDGADDRT